jgi:hypothetical protein
LGQSITDNVSLESAVKMKKDTRLSLDIL